ncbi:molybdopterin dinucleotide binding domain-containing protein [Mycobacterium sp. URHB0021]
MFRCIWRAPSPSGSATCSGKYNEVIIHPDDADALVITEGDRVKVFSSVGAIELSASVNDRPRRGVIVIDHGWGSRIFDPRGGATSEAFAANRNLLIDGGPVDPLAQTTALSSSYVGLERVDRS